VQDPSGDGKIVYLFLPLYKVRMTVSDRDLFSDGGIDVQRTVPVSPACSGLSKYWLQCHMNKYFMSLRVDNVWTGLRDLFGGLYIRLAC
jgi:hypothetical protein